MPQASPYSSGQVANVREGHGDGSVRGSVNRYGEVHSQISAGNVTAKPPGLAQSVH